MEVQPSELRGRRLIRLGHTILFKLFLSHMKTILVTVCFVAILLFPSFSLLIAQTENIPDEITIADEITAEGKMLYTLEKASWTGTDVFQSQHLKKNYVVGGYFSYIKQENVFCIFFTEEPLPHVIASIAFDRNLPSQVTSIDTFQRDFFPIEQDLYTLRMRTLQRINSDTSITRYRDTNFNLVPIIKDTTRKVYILSGSTVDSVAFGGDYLCSFDQTNTLLDVKKLHASLLFFPFKEDSALEKSAIRITSYHTHGTVAGDFITATDICTIMLYAPYTNWGDAYYVISERFVSIWNCKNERLVIITREVWDKISDDQKKRTK
jgi:hypothetical protein